MHQDDPLDTVLLGFSDKDSFTIRDSFEGVQIFGGIGSGKTSGSGKLFAHSFLESGYGGLVLTAKVDETDLWKKYAEQAGRADDLIIINPEAQNCFNFLEYEQSLPHADAGLTENIVRLFESVVQSTRTDRSSGGINEQFWMDEFRKLLRNAVDLLRFAEFPLKLKLINDLVFSAATSPEEAYDPEWAKKSFCNRAIRKAFRRGKKFRKHSSEYNDLELTFDYWIREYPLKPDKTRSTVTAVFSGVTDVFLRGFLNNVFSSQTTVTPEDSLNGKIIILDFPQKRYNELGVMAQVLFKMVWQRAMERRDITDSSRPVFLWIDESQFFVNRYDVNFQTTARSARVATVLLTQNLPNYYAALGGEKASKAFVDSLLGNLSTKVFHNNTCATTNQYAADLFAQEWQSVSSSSQSQSEGKLTFGSGESLQLKHSILPREFTGLKRGGPLEDFLVEGIVHQGGKVFQTSGINALKTVFSQNLN